MTGYTVEVIDMRDAHRSARGGADCARRRDWHVSYDAFVRAGEDRPAGNRRSRKRSPSRAWQLGRGKESVRVTERVFTQLARTRPARPLR